MYPKVLVFSCNWNGWSCIEAATNSGLHYPSSVRIIRVSCLSRLHAGLLLKAFEFGADGVMLLGCELDGCSFEADNGCVYKEYKKVRNILSVLGIQEERLALVHLPAFDGYQFVTELTNFFAKIQVTVPKRTKEVALESS